MRKFLVGVAALAAVSSVALAPSEASARPWDGGWRGGWHRAHWGGGTGWAVGAGLLGFGLGLAAANTAYAYPYPAYAAYPVTTTRVVYVRPRRVIYRTAFAYPPRRIVRRVGVYRAAYFPRRTFVRRVTYHTGPAYMRTYRRAVYWR